MDGYERYVMDGSDWKAFRFRVSLDGQALGAFEARAMKWEGGYDWGGTPFAVQTKSAFKSSAALMSPDGRQIADGVSKGMFPWTYTVSGGGRSFLMKEDKKGVLKYDIFENGVQVGDGQGASYASSNGTVTLLAAMPWECKLLFFWILGRQWRSATADGATTQRS